VPLRELADLAKRAAVWRQDQALGQWTRVEPAGPGRGRPGEVLIVTADAGGYHLETGFDPAVKELVPDCPIIGVTPERTVAEDTEAGGVIDIAAGAEDAFGADPASVAQRNWVSLQQHSDETREQARALISVLGPNLPDGPAAAAVTAAYLHDAGKAHPTWQDALCALAPPERQEEIAAGRPWAKSASDRPLRFDGRAAFRHELASLLVADGPLHALLADAPDPGLVRYLILAHHGRLRVQVRDPGEATPGMLLGLTQDEATPIPAMFGLPPGELTVDLGQFSLGGERSWTRDALALRDHYGPFVLAYLETLVRVADWRASAGIEVPR
jgi:CRISPR-associated endonuclease/helicase Cas3